MKIKCNLDVFRQAYQAVAGVVPRRSPKDVLKNVHVGLNDGLLTLTGTDMEVSVSTTVPDAECEDASEVLLPANKVSTILRESQAAEILIESEDGRVTITAGGSVFRLQTEDAREFPPVSGFDPSIGYWQVPLPAFQKAVKRTTYATDDDSSRYALGGVLIAPKDAELVFASTDSRRLAVTQVACDILSGATAPDRKTIIPAQAMSLGLNMKGETADIQLLDNAAVIRSGDTVIHSRLVEGRFPKYEDVIPSTGNVNVPLSVSPVYAAVRQAQIMTSEESRAIDLTFAEGQLKMSSRSQDVGESKVEVPIEYSHEGITVSLNPKYLVDFFRVLEAEQLVDLQLIDENHAVVFRVDGGTYTYVLMPLAQNS